MNAIKLFCKAALAALAAAVIAKSVAQEFAYPHNLHDISLRVNEIHAMHEGLNPFHVWDGSVQSEKYRPAPTVGYKPGDDDGDPRAPVAYYPPWHALLTWWYGSLSPQDAGTLLNFANGLALAALALFFLRFPLFRGDCGFADAALAWLVFSAFLAAEFTWNSLTGNYGAFAMGCTVLLAYALEKDGDLLAAAAFTLLSVKPQIAALFGWPLLFGRKWKPLFAAGVFAAAGTLFVAWRLDESPVALIQQIFDVGKPFLEHTDKLHIFRLGELATRLFGPLGANLATISCFAACGILSFLLRNEREWWLKMLPPAIFFPFWTYSWPYDTLAAWPLILAMTLMAFGQEPFRFKSKSLRLCASTVLAIALFELALVRFRHSAHISYRLVFPLFGFAALLKILWTARKSRAAAR